MTNSSSLLKTYSQHLVEVMLRTPTDGGCDKGNICYQIGTITNECHARLENGRFVKGVVINGTIKDYALFQNNLKEIGGRVGDKDTELSVDIFDVLSRDINHIRNISKPDITEGHLAADGFQLNEFLLIYVEVVNVG